MPIVAAINSIVFMCRYFLIHGDSFILHAIPEVGLNPPIPWLDASVKIVISTFVNAINSYSPLFGMMVEYISSKVVSLLFQSYLFFEVRTFHIFFVVFSAYSKNILLVVIFSLHGLGVLLFVPFVLI